MLPHDLDLISLRHRELNAILHADPRGFGGRGKKWAPVVTALVAQHGATSVLDYGCGQGSLAHALRETLPTSVRVDEYDPAIPEKQGLPVFADLVVCTDVLEHVEPDKLDTVLRHLKLLARKAVFVVVSTVETAKVLADGRNAHLTVQSGDWWRDRLKQAKFRVLPAPSIARQKPEKEWTAVLTS